MTLLWPEMPLPSGQDNLRQTLYQLRKAIPEVPVKAGEESVPFLLATRQTVQLNPEAAYDLDVAAFSQWLNGQPTLEALEQAVNLYRGDFLADLYLPDSNEFETWATNQRTALCRQALDALDRLSDTFHEQGIYDKAETYTRRQIELDSLRESAHRQLIAIMAQNGRRGEALIHFEQFRESLHDELGVEPEPETAALYERIWSGEYGSASAIPNKRLPLGRLEQTIRFVTSFDGTRVAYATVGQGPPLVMTATFLTHLEFDWQTPVWQHRLEAFLQNHTVIRYDERGSGLSDWDVENLSFEAWVHDLEAIVDALGLERFPLYGQSQGGPVAVAYAARHPEKVSHLILFGAYARGWLNRDLTLEQVEEERIMMKLIRIGWGRDNPAFRQFFATQLMPDATFDQLQSLDELARISTTPENAFRLESEMHRIDVQDLARQVRAPTLVLHCRDDQGVPFNEGRLLTSLIPGARFVALNSRNHLLTEGEPAWLKFLEHVRHFLTTEQKDAAASGLP